MPGLAGERGYPGQQGPEGSTGPTGRQGRWGWFWEVVYRAFAGDYGVLKIV